MTKVEQFSDHVRNRCLMPLEWMVKLWSGTFRLLEARAFLRADGSFLFVTPVPIEWMGTKLKYVNDDQNEILLSSPFIPVRKSRIYRALCLIVGSWEFSDSRSWSVSPTTMSKQEEHFPSDFFYCFLFSSSRFELVSIDSPTLKTEVTYDVGNMGKNLPRPCSQARGEQQMSNCIQ